MTAPRLDPRTLRRVFWRSLFLQAAWNPKGMQNLGFAFALYPALEKLYPDPEKLAAATERHLCCFNSHPYFAATILGGAVHHEEKIARGEEPPEAVVGFKQALMGPLAALGDGFFWLSLRPACGALTAALASAIALAVGDLVPPAVVALGAIAFYLLGYNVVHLVMRARFFWHGYRLGDAVVPDIAASRLPELGQRLRVVAAASAGVAGGLGALTLPAEAHVLRWAALGAAATFAVCHLLLAKGLSPYVLAYAAAALALCIGLVF